MTGRFALGCIASLVLALLAGCIGGAPDADGAPSTDPSTTTAAEPAATEAPADEEPVAPDDPPVQPETPEPQRPASDPAVYAPGWPGLGDAVVRPGIKLFDSFQRQVAGHVGQVQYLQCTANFVFGSPDNRTLYIGTASHCVSGFALGDPIVLAEGRANGTLAYCSFAVHAGGAMCPDTGPTGADPDDFALIRIDDVDRPWVHPALLGLGGPTGLAPGAAVGDTAYTYGNSDRRDMRLAAAPDTLDARRGRVALVSDWTLDIAFDPSSLPGDSGSPVILADGRALGVVQTLGSADCPGGRADVNGVVNLSRALAAVQAAGGPAVVLKTWPLLPAEFVVPELPVEPCPAGLPW